MTYDAVFALRRNRRKNPPFLDTKKKRRRRRVSAHVLQGGGKNCDGCDGSRRHKRKCFLDKGLQSVANQGDLRRTATAVATEAARLCAPSHAVRIVQKQV